VLSGERNILTDDAYDSAHQLINRAPFCKLHTRVIAKRKNVQNERTTMERYAENGFEPTKSKLTAKTVNALRRNKTGKTATEEQ
jgi:hypothetical protein